MTETNREKLERLMAQYGTALIRMCAVYLRDADLAQDAAQDTFIKAYRNMDTFRGECSEKSWLMGIAIHICRDYQRSAWFRHTDRRMEPDKLPEIPVPAVIPDHTVLTEVNRLPKRYREVILLRYYQGMKLKETADALKCSRSTVKQRLRKANTILRNRLKEWYYDEE